MANATETLVADYNIGIKPHVVGPLKESLKKVAPSLELDEEWGHWPTWPAKTKRREDLIRVSIRITDVSQIALIRTALMHTNFDPSVRIGHVFHHHVLTDPANDGAIIKFAEARFDG